MARQVSLPALQAMIAQNTEQVVLEFLDITHPDLPDPIRIVNDMQNQTRNSNTYIAFPFSIDLPKDEDGSIESVTLSVTTVDQQIPNIIRSLQTPFTVTLNIALASSLDTTEAGPFEFTCLGAQFNSGQATITLGFYQYLLNQTFPGDNFAPYNAVST